MLSICMVWEGIDLTGVHMEGKNAMVTVSKVGKKVVQLQNLATWLVESEEPCAIRIHVSASCAWEDDGLWGQLSCEPHILLISNWASLFDGRDLSDLFLLLMNSTNILYSHSPTFFHWEVITVAQEWFVLLRGVKSLCFLPSGPGWGFLWRQPQ